MELSKDLDHRPIVFLRFNPDPPQFLQVAFCFPCSQIPDPPQSLHHAFCFPCSQIPDPPQSLHRALCFPCSHFFIDFLTSLIILHKTIFFDKVILRILSQLNYEILQDFNKIIELFLSFCLSHYLSNIEFDVTR